MIFDFTLDINDARPDHVTILLKLNQECFGSDQKNSLASFQSLSLYELKHGEFHRELGQSFGFKGCFTLDYHSAEYSHYRCQIAMKYLTELSNNSTKALRAIMTSHICAMQRSWCKDNLKQLEDQTLEFQFENDILSGCANPWFFNKLKSLNDNQRSDLTALVETVMKKFQNYVSLGGLKLEFIEDGLIIRNSAYFIDLKSSDKFFSSNGSDYFHKHFAAWICLLTVNSRLRELEN